MTKIIQPGKIIIANCNESLNGIQNELLQKYNAFSYTKKDDLTLENLEKIEPDYIFFMHWSWIIPANIFEKYECIVFHMTDLPYGRGGSPLQNLIVRGHTSTKLSAIKVDAGIDTGDIYLKKNLELNGAASEIFVRTGHLIKEMIDEILVKKIQPVKQIGEPVYFKRRTPGQSQLGDDLKTIDEVYNFIRMLDAPNYPHAFIETEFFKFEFNAANFSNNGELTAHVRITKK